MRSTRGRRSWRYKTSKCVEREVYHPVIIYSSCLSKPDFLSHMGVFLQRIRACVFNTVNVIITFKQQNTIIKVNLVHITHALYSTLSSGKNEIIIH